MNAPHRRYLQFLVVAGFTDDEVCRLLELDGFQVPDLGAMAAERIALANRPSGLALGDPADERSMNWLREHRLTGLVRRDAAAERAIALLRSSNRTAVELLLLGRVSPGETAEFLALEGVPDVTPEAVQAFEAYFWDVDGTPVDKILESRSLHPLRAMYAAAVTAEDDEFFAAVKRLVMGHQRNLPVQAGPRFPGGAGVPVGMRGAD
jgi:hypothetical protein